jgi:queuine tRNA-ribosyltransferase
MSFTVLAQDKTCPARAGVLDTPRGPVETPVFMPVATQASVKALDSDDMRRLGAKAILANSYHLYLRPGVDLMQAAGGLHRFMDYEGFILTDSGGFQVLSLSKLRQVDDQGVTGSPPSRSSTYSAVWARTPGPRSTSSSPIRRRRPRR